jgi:hypothetical protein
VIGQGVASHPDLVQVVDIVEGNNIALGEGMAMVRQRKRQGAKGKERWVADFRDQHGRLCSKTLATESISPKTRRSSRHGRGHDKRGAVSRASLAGY